MTPARLKEWRLQKNYSLEQLGEVLADVSGPTVSRWETGVTEIPGPVNMLLDLLIDGIQPFEISAAAEIGNTVREDIGDVAMTVDAFEECLRRSREAGFVNVTEWIAHLVREELKIPGEQKLRKASA